MDLEARWAKERMDLAAPRSVCAGDQAYKTRREEPPLSPGTPLAA